MTTRELLDAELERLGLAVNAEARTRLTIYIDELQRWNRTINLTSLEGAVLVRRLVAEPIWIGEQLQMSGILMDVGSGNGSPAIPLCVARLWTEAHLIEPRTRRAAFLRNIISKLELKHVSVHKTRVQEVTDLPRVLDWITLQAVSPTPDVRDALCRVASATTLLVWITSGMKPAFVTEKHLVVLNSQSEAWIFRVDHF